MGQRGSGEGNAEEYKVASIRYHDLPKILILDTKYLILKNDLPQKIPDPEIADRKCEQLRTDGNLSPSGICSGSKRLFK